ncbi:amidohydrolase family protein [Paraburkholderia xenovorans]|uniref:amidohydrolase family protein n=1 Tax=Paraburkholderia xenovorans TaxID=36873 RepID=UPI0038BAD604
MNRADVFSAWRSHVQQLARYPNLSIKIGGFGMLFCGWDFHLHSVPPSSEDLSIAWRPYVETCIEALGPKRCMFESNFPVDKQSSSYAILWNAFKRITKNFSTEEKSNLYFNTAVQKYKLGAVI